MSIASAVISQVGKQGTRRKYREALVELLSKYQGAQYDDPGEFGEVSGVRSPTGPVEAGEMYFFNYIATKLTRIIILSTLIFTKKFYKSFTILSSCTLFSYL